MSSPVRRCEVVGPGSQRRAAGDYCVVWALKSPGAAPPVRSRSPSAARDKAGAAGQRAFVGDPTAGSHAAPAAGRGTLLRCGANGPACRGATCRGGGFSPLATRAESSDRRVSGPSVERARLRGRGGSGSLYRRLSAGPVAAEAVPRSKPTSAGAQRSTQNWHGPGESDCLIKTKHCDGQRWMLTQCDFCPVL